MQQKIELNAQMRSVIGRKVKSLRQEGLVPAVMYGKGQEPLNIQIPVKDFNYVLKKAGESTLVYLNVEKQTFPTIIHDVSRDHADDNIIHADFYKVRLDEKISAKVPVEFIGESPAVKNDGGILVRNINELEVRAFPQDLPHDIKVDLSKLVVFKDQILAKDIKLDASVELLANPEQIIVLVQEPMSEEELEKSLGGESVDVSEVKIGQDKEEVAEETEEPAESPTESEDSK